MQEEELYDVLRAPIINEKSTRFVADRKYVFKVMPYITKSQVKAAVEKIFKVKVNKINVSIVKGKVKHFRGTKGKQSDYKKAIVTLAENNEIDLSASVK